MSAKLERAGYGAKAVAGLTGALPNPFPRSMGPNAIEYLREVVDGGLTGGMIGRFDLGTRGGYGVGEEALCRHR